MKVWRGELTPLFFWATSVPSADILRHHSTQVHQNNVGILW
jgi:hypothetical protein